jgi:hypothetical protein
MKSKMLQNLRKKTQLGKKVSSIISSCLSFQSVFAQSVFDKFDGQDDVTSIIVNKKMFDLMSKVKVDASIKQQ